MRGLSFGLRAKNSVSDMRLMVDKQDDGGIDFCLVGEHEGEELQINFEELTHQEALDLADYIRGRAARR